jgi:transposase
MEKKIKKTRHRKYDAQFKQEALKQVENGQSVGSVAQALGISEALLYSWRKRLTVSSIIPNTEVDQLRKQVKQLEMERDILKKALTIFSR